MANLPSHEEEQGRGVPDGRPSQGTLRAELQRRGLFRTSYTTSTFREHLSGVSLKSA